VLLKAIELDRSNAQAARNLGIAMNHLGRSKESVSQFLRSIELFDEPQEKATSWNRLGDAYRQLNDYDNAIAAYQTADMLIHNREEKNCSLNETLPVKEIRQQFARGAGLFRYTGLVVRSIHRRERSIRLAEISIPQSTACRVGSLTRANAAQACRFENRGNDIRQT
jgi:tetratricopeptide (TPR) repeat protein